MTDEDKLLEVAAPGVLENDADPENSSLIAVLGTGPANGTLSFNSDGSFQFRPSDNSNGVVSFTYRASDGELSSNLATVTVTVSAVNDAPVAVADAYSTEVNSPLSVAAPGVLINDTDLEGSDLTAVLVDGPSSGSFVLNQDGSFNFTPSDVAGDVSFTYQAFDGAALSAPVTVTISVTQGNQAPQAASDSYSAQGAAVLVVDSSNGLLSNDTPTDGDLSVVSSTPVAEGNLGRLLFADDFETDVQGPFQSTLTNWSVVNGSGVDVLQDAFGFPSSSNFVDLDAGDSSTNARLESNELQLVEGIYVLAFTLGNNPGQQDAPNTMTVSVGGVPVGQFGKQGSQAPSPTACYVELPTAVTNGRIVFDHSETPPDGGGLLIDDVRLFRLNADGESLPADGGFVYVAPLFNPENEEPPQFSGAVGFAYTIDDGSGTTSTADVSIADLVPGECGKLTFAP